LTLIIQSLSAGKNSNYRKNGAHHAPGYSVEEKCSTVIDKPMQKLWIKIKVYSFIKAKHL